MMSRNPPTPLGPTAADVLDTLRDPLVEADGLSRDAATELVAGGDLDAQTARDAIEQLRLRGYLYEVNGELFVTPTE
jgi:hypothetical protein